MGAEEEKKVEPPNNNSTRRSPTPSGTLTESQFLSWKRQKVLRGFQIIFPFFCRLL